MSNKQEYIKVTIPNGDFWFTTKEEWADTVDDWLMNEMKDGDKVIIEVIEMTEEEFLAMPEYGQL